LHRSRVGATPGEVGESAIPVDDPDAALAPIHHIQSLTCSGVKLQVLVLNVQPPFHRHLMRHTTRRRIAALRAEQ
jgi:hypothetical protein